MMAEAAGQVASLLCVCVCVCVRLCVEVGGGQSREDTILVGT